VVGSPLTLDELDQAVRQIGEPVRVEPVHRDDRGAITDLLPPDVAIRHIGLIEALAGAHRGGHFHREKYEWFYLFSGRAFATLHPAGRPALFKRFVLHDRMRLFVPKNVTHRYEFAVDSVVFDFSPAVFDPNDLNAD